MPRPIFARPIWEDFGRILGGFWILVEDALWSFWVVLYTFGRFWVKKTQFFSVVLSGRAKNPKSGKFAENFSSTHLSMKFRADSDSEIESSPHPNPGILFFSLF